MSARYVQSALLVALAACGKPDADGTRGESAASVAPAAADPAAPDSFNVAFVTGQGRFVVQAKRAWAPHGVDRFHALVTNGYYDGVKFFRVVDGFVVQFGMHGDPATHQRWDRNIPDDPVKESNKRGTLTFATMGPNTRTTQLFINTGDNVRLDQMGFSPFGRIVEGYEVVNKLYGGYGESPDQQSIQRDGNRYLNRFFPKLDSIISARVIN